MQVYPFETRFQSLIQEFLNHEVPVDKFCSDFTTLWMSYRDEQETVKQNWAEPYDQQLIEACLRGELTPQEFSERYLQLWEFTEPASFRDMVDAIHSACSAFNPLPAKAWEIDEQRLRREIQTLFTKDEDNP